MKKYVQKSLCISTSTVQTDFSYLGTVFFCAKEKTMVFYRVSVQKKASGGEFYEKPFKRDMGGCGWLGGRGCVGGVVWESEVGSI